MFQISDDRHLPVQLRSLAQFRALRRSGRFAPVRLEPHARQWISQLRAHDAIAQGASERDIAAVLFDRLFAPASWRTDRESVRSAVRRLVATSRRMVAGDYRKLLG